jgi:hypothetical protein
VVLAGVGFWLILNGILSIVKYPKQTFPEQLIRVTRAIGWNYNNRSRKNLN